MKKLAFIILASLGLTACPGQFPIARGYVVYGEPAFPELMHLHFGYLFHNDHGFVQFIAGSVTHVYYSKKILIAQQDSLSVPTWYVITPGPGCKLLQGPEKGDFVEGPLTTLQLDSVLRERKVCTTWLQHEDYTKWWHPKFRNS